MENADFSCFTDGSYLENESGKYCAGSAKSFQVIEVALLPLTQQAKLYTHRSAFYPRAKQHYTDSGYDFEWLKFLEFMEIMWLPTSGEDKIINSPYTQEFLVPDSYLLLCLLLRSLGHSNLDSQEDKGNHIADISAKNAAF